MRFFYVEERGTVVCVSYNRSHAEECQKRLNKKPDGCAKLLQGLSPSQTVSIADVIALRARVVA